MRPGLAMPRRGLLTALLLTSAAALAWETYVADEDKHEEWKSIYYLEDARTTPGSRGPRKVAGTDAPPVGFTENEHREQAYVTLQDLGVGVHLATPVEPLHVVDLNASLFRPQLLQLGTIASKPRGTIDDPDPGALERRRVPAPAQFASLPDFSYSIYGWINKNNICPALPSGAMAINRCHMFTAGWLSALNSSHFGSQATKNYKRQHTIALGLAERARNLREQIEKSDTSGVALQAYREYVREAEWMALAYEGTAQHFLQDRLALGHMWERWGSANVMENASPDLPSLVLLGAVSGLVHGSETVTMRSALLNNNILGAVAGKDVPDLLSSPIVVNGEAVPGQFKVGANGPYAGVGDHRLEDLYRGKFGGEYAAIGKDHLIGVQKQREMLNRCTQSGWSAVILELGKSKGGGYGLHGLRPKTEVSEVPSDCFEGWATNASMAMAALGDQQFMALMFLRVTISVAGGSQLPRQGLDQGLLLYRILKETLLDKNGTSLARGEIGPYGDAQPGNKYGEAAYLEPRNILELPEFDERGRDKRAVFGFFNRAHTDHWCERLPAELEKLRGKPADSRERAACFYLADRAYDGTDPRYKGKQMERRTLDGKRDSSRVRPICEIVGKASFAEGKTPARLPPGYVSTPDVGPETAGPYSRQTGNLTTYSVANWCARRPVLNLLERDGELDKDDLVAEVRSPGALITIRGADLGARKGTLRLRVKGEDAFTVTDIESWSDNEIRFRLPPDRQGKAEDYFVILRTGEDASEGRNITDQSSAGRFVVRVSRAPELSGCACPEVRAAVAHGKAAEGAVEHELSLKQLELYFSNRHARFGGDWSAAMQELVHDIDPGGALGMARGAKPVPKRPDIAVRETGLTSALLGTAPKLHASALDASKELKGIAPSIRNPLSDGQARERTGGFGPSISSTDLTRFAILTLARINKYGEPEEGLRAALLAVMRMLVTELARGSNDMIRQGGKGEAAAAYGKQVRSYLLQNISYAIPGGDKIALRNIERPRLKTTDGPKKLLLDPIDWANAALDFVIAVDGEGRVSSPLEYWDANDYLAERLVFSAAGRSLYGGPFKEGSLHDAVACKAFQLVTALGDAARKDGAKWRKEYWYKEIDAGRSNPDIPHAQYGTNGRLFASVNNMLNMSRVLAGVESASEMEDWSKRMLESAFHARSQLGNATASDALLNSVRVMGIYAGGPGRNTHRESVSSAAERYFEPVRKRPEYAGRTETAFYAAWQTSGASLGGGGMQQQCMAKGMRAALPGSRVSAIK